jgi:uncharacterized protein
MSGTHMDIEATRGLYAEPFGGARSGVEGGSERASGGNRGAPGSDAVAVLAPFVRQHTVLLTTYRQNGTAVGTPVHVAVDGGRAFVRTWDETWKLKRIRNTPEVEVAPSTFRGVPTGPAIHARARILDGDEAVAAGRALAHKYPVMHGVLVPLVHRLRGNTTMHVELTPVFASDGPTERGQAR